VRSGSVLVLGAGPAGLAFSHRYGIGSVVLEKSNEIGGLSRSIEILDGVFDIGGHSFHTHHREVLELVCSLMKGKWFQQPRDARVWVAGEMIPYPFQHHFEKLENERIVRDCIGHITVPDLVAQSSHFEEWILRCFGNGIAEHFMLPYNKKLWARNLMTMSCNRVDERVATDNKCSPSAKFDKSKRRPLLSNSSVAYPSEGGFGSIFTTLARHCHRIELGEEVVHIDTNKHTLNTRSGTLWRWENIVSTIPLPHLLHCINECPEYLIRLASELEAVSLKILLVLVKRRECSVPQRIYIADPCVPPHKITFNHTSSPSLLNREHHAITCEVSYSPAKPVLHDRVLLNTTAEWLIANRFIHSMDDIVAKKVIDVPFGYPVNTHAKHAILSEIINHIGKYGIYSIGRFGAWDYVNSDECIHQGFVLADRLGIQ